MAERNVVIICSALDKAKSLALCGGFPGGVNLSIPLCVAAASYGPATHWACSGPVDESLITAFDGQRRITAIIGGIVSLTLDLTLTAPYEVYELGDSTTFDQIIAARLGALSVPAPLHRMMEAV